MPKPAVVSITKLKGGVGATTTSVNLAAALHERGHRVLLVDGDPQRLALWWSRQGPGFAFEVAAEDTARAQSFEVVIVDTKAAPEGEDLAYLLETSDLVIVPAQPQGLALESTRQFVRGPLARARDYRVLITMSDPRSRDGEEAVDALREGKVKRFMTPIRLYKAHQRASEVGVPITDYKGPHARDAARDYQRLAEEVALALRLPEPQREEATD